MKLQPRHDRVIVSPIPEATETASGIILAVSAKEKPRTGIVVSVGPGALKEDGTRIPNDLAPGDKVFFGKYAALEAEINGETIVMLKDEDILGKFEDLV